MTTDGQGTEDPLADGPGPVLHDGAQSQLDDGDDPATGPIASGSRQPSLAPPGRPDGEVDTRP